MCLCEVLIACIRVCNLHLFRGTSSLNCCWDAWQILAEEFSEEAYQNQIALPRAARWTMAVVQQRALYIMEKLRAQWDLCAPGDMAVAYNMDVMGGPTGGAHEPQASAPQNPDAQLVLPVPVAPPEEPKLPVDPSVTDRPAKYVFSCPCDCPPAVCTGHSMHVQMHQELKARSDMYTLSVCPRICINATFQSLSQDSSRCRAMFC